ncbi:type II secretion system protein GspG [candidate division NPL-UPA2 bacterium]|nr:type II secretion system protein GspG [candidate division NPL-UPA2 bacterium]
MRQLRSKIKGYCLRVSGCCRGFTVVELLTVIAIIAILAAIIMPALRRARIKAHEAKAKSMIAQLEIALSMYKTDFGSYPDYDGESTQYDAEADEILALLTGRDPDDPDWDLEDGEPGELDTIGNPNWNGPYLEVKKDDIKWINGGNYLKDPWGNPYVIIVDLDGGTSTTYPRHNTFGFDIYSFGPDGMTEGPDGEETSDPTCSTAWDHYMDGNSDDATSAYCDKSMDDINNW